MNTNAEASVAELNGTLSCWRRPVQGSNRFPSFAFSVRPEQLTEHNRELYKRNILDSIGCALAALPGPPFQALREQFEEYRSSGTCTLIGGGKTSHDQAALFNSGLVRYVDLLDSYTAAQILAMLSWA
jgi:2-methylcitrate dehydratase PrpD